MLDPIRPTSLAFDANGELWFAGSGYPVSPDGLISPDTIGLVGRVSAGKETTEFRLGPSTRSPESSIVAGPDGAMWFVLSSMDAVGRVTLDGVTSSFPLPPKSEPVSIVSGPDGNLWVAERGSGKIARMTPSGELTEFGFGDDSAPAGIAVGPDGELWFTLAHLHQVGRLTPAGERTVYQLARGTYPGSIAATAAGLWFAESPRRLRRGLRPAGRVGFISTAGARQQIAIPSHNATAAIASAPDGTVWYATSPSPAVLGSISPGGKARRPVCAVDAECTAPPVALAVSPSDALWFGTGEYECGICGGSASIGLEYTPALVGHLGSR